MSKISSTLPRFVLVLGASLLLLVGMGFTQDDTDNNKDETSIQKRIVNAAHVLDEIMGTPDKAIPDKVMHDAKCIAVIPAAIFGLGMFFLPKSPRWLMKRGRCSEAVAVLAHHGNTLTAIARIPSGVV